MWNTAPDVERIPTSLPSGRVRRKRPPPLDPNCKQTTKAARDTLYKDIARELKQPPVWQPDQVRLPPVAIDEPVPAEWMSKFLRRPEEGELACIRGVACLGCTLAVAYRRRGYTLRRFQMPGGRVVAGLCIMCLRQALANQQSDALGVFSICDYALTTDAWTLA